MAWIYIQMLPSLCGVCLTECTCWGYLLLYTWSVRISHLWLQILSRNIQKIRGQFKLCISCLISNHFDSLKMNLPNICLPGYRYSYFLHKEKRFRKSMFWEILSGDSFSPSSSLHAKRKLHLERWVNGRNKEAVVETNAISPISNCSPSRGIRWVVQPNWRDLSIIGKNCLISNTTSGHTK